MYTLTDCCCSFADLPPETGNDERLLRITPSSLSLDYKPNQVNFDQQILEVSIDHE